jgi:hypothetical protein
VKTGDGDSLKARSPAEDAQDAIDLVTALRDMLIAAANSMGGGDDARYYQTHQELDDVLHRLGVRMPFPWPMLREGVEAAKTEYSGAGSFHRRREYFKNRAEPTLVTLRRRVADYQSGDIAASLAGLRTAAAETLSDISSIRAELERVERALPQDPSVAIGKAKNLVEATAKIILSELGRPPAENAKVRDVATAAARA